MSQFSHLHLHTQYSLLDGAIRVKDLFTKVHELGMNSVAVTDHGNMFGAIDLYTEAKAKDIKLIFGCETYVASSDRHDRTNRRNYHLILLAQNEVGYKNLSFLNSKGYLEGFYYNPRIDKQLLRDHSDGLIGMSACLGGEIAQTLAKHGVAAAEERQRYASMFARGTSSSSSANGHAGAEHAERELVRMAISSGSAGRHQRLPLRQPHGCAGARRPDAIQTGKPQGRERSSTSSTATT